MRRPHIIFSYYCNLADTSVPIHICITIQIKLKKVLLKLFIVSSSGDFGPDVAHGHKIYFLKCAVKINSATLRQSSVQFWASLKHKKQNNIKSTLQIIDKQMWKTQASKKETKNSKRHWAVQNEAKIHNNTMHYKSKAMLIKHAKTHTKQFAQRYEYRNYHHHHHHCSHKAVITAEYSRRCYVEWAKIVVSSKFQAEFSLRSTI